jgi:NADPH:quinone reductase-like Zn-dependent oxidoreductase
MKAAVTTRYGPPEVVEIREVATPQPQAGELLVRVHATTVTRTDCGMRAPHPWFVRLAEGLLRPRHRVLGIDFAGVVQAVGAGVVAYRPGDRVFGLSPEAYGAHAEYLCLPERAPLAAMPAGAAFHECVVGEGAWYAETYLQRLRLGAGRRILIYGGSGAIGTAAVQLAKARGAHVTAVVSTRHLALARSLGADAVVDYTTTDLTRLGQTFDAVLDAVGKTSYFRCRPLLAPHGIYIAIDLGPAWQNVWLALASALIRRERVMFPLPQAAQARGVVDALGAAMARQTFRAVIDRRYPLEAIVQAYRYVETGEKTGIVVIDVAAG